MEHWYEMDYFLFSRCFYPICPQSLCNNTASVQICFTTKLCLNKCYEDLSETFIAFLIFYKTCYMPKVINSEKDVEKDVYVNRLESVNFSM